MSDIEAVIKRISSYANEVGEARLSKESGVPYTTIRSLVQRKFRNRYFNNLLKLDAAAKSGAEDRQST